MTARTAPLLLAALIVFALAGCASPTDGDNGVGTTPPDETGSNSSAMRLAPGLYDMENGTVQAVGTLEYRDLEGGLWAIVGGTEAEGGTGQVVAVIANADELKSTLEPLRGLSVSATGTRFDGASIRMAGPEIVVDTIVEVSDTAGVAE